MAYSDFSIEDLKKKFGINSRIQSIFENPIVSPISQTLREDLEEVKTLRIRTEKAKSEWIVVPILNELRKRNNRYFTIYSGESLNVDKENGLQGECDFILAKDVQSFDLNYPIIQIVEAKKHDIEIGIPQCMAQLLGAKIFNDIHQTPISKIYGCVTTGDDWLFMYLENDTVYVDNKRYYLTEVEKILGVFQTIIDFCKNELK
jgi:hypothetical protein